MDLSLLQSIRKQSSQLASQRHQKSDTAYTEALQALAEAQDSGFQDKIALKKASTQFLKAIQMARGKVEPYVGMSYLLMIIGNERQAVRYLQYARNIDANHPDVQKLLEYLQDPEAFARDHVPEGVDSKSLDSESFDAELLNASSDTQTSNAVAKKPSPRSVHDFIHHISELNRSISELPLKPALGNDAVAAMRERINEWEDVMLTLQDDISELEALENVQSLNQAQQVLERRLEKFRGVYKDSRQLTRIHKDIRTLQKNVLQSMKETSSYEDLEERLEHYLDECDRIADLLDEADEKGLDIDPVTGAYESLTEMVERFQDHVDDQKNE